MDLSSPARTVVPTLDAEVLMVLVGISAPLTGRQITRLAETGSQKGVSVVLDRLRKHGLVDVVEAGNSNLYSLNRDHVAISAVEALVDLRGKLFERMAETIMKWQVRPESVAVFGSAARGDGGTDSDIDILVLRPESLYRSSLDEFGREVDQNSNEDWDRWSTQLYEFGRLVLRWSGNPASLIQTTRSQLKDMQENQEPIIKSLQSDIRQIWGKDVKKILNEKS